MSFTPAKQINAKQQLYHRLRHVIEKHQQTLCKPIATHNQYQYAIARQYWEQQGRPCVLLDSACGTAQSSRYLAMRYPKYLVIGLDQSLDRLSHSANAHPPKNCLLLRCDCTDFWRLAAQDQWQFEKHYLLYPNPWPKPNHFKRRWHGHPAFPNLH